MICLHVSCYYKYKHVAVKGFLYVQKEAFNLYVYLSKRKHKQHKQYIYMIIFLCDFLVNVNISP